MSFFVSCDLFLEKMMFYLIWVLILDCRRFGNFEVYVSAVRVFVVFGGLSSLSGKLIRPLVVSLVMESLWFCVD